MHDRMQKIKKKQRYLIFALSKIIVLEKFNKTFRKIRVILVESTIKKIARMFYFEFTNRKNSTETQNEYAWKHIYYF